jgi:hypothetical protein
LEKIVSMLLTIFTRRDEAPARRAGCRTPFQRADANDAPTPHANSRTITTGHGYEILSDYQRSLLKLPPRGRPDGCTIEEILAWETCPLIMAVEASGSGFSEKCEKTPVTSSSKPGSKDEKL